MMVHSSCQRCLYLTAAIAACSALTQPVLEEFVGLDNGIVQNATVACPMGYNAIGYSALATFSGIAYLDVRPFHLQSELTRW